MIRVGIIGYGYWGPHIARNFHAADDCEVSVICDKSPAAQGRIQRAYPGVRATCDVSEVLSSPQIDAVAVITPVWTHFELAKAALENGKHVFVEKPFTSTVAQAEQLIELAAKKHLTIMVDHTFLFTGAVKKIEQLTKDGTLASFTTTIPPGSISGCSSTTLTSSGTWHLTTFRSWTTSCIRNRNIWLQPGKAI